MWFLKLLFCFSALLIQYFLIRYIHKRIRLKWPIQFVSWLFQCLLLVKLRVLFPEWINFNDYASWGLPTTLFEIERYIILLISLPISVVIYNVIGLGLLLITPLGLSCIQVAFFFNAWLLYKILGWNYSFLKNCLKYIFFSWFLFLQLPFLLAFPFARDDAGYDSELYKDIPYEYSLSNAQFCMDLNMGLLLLSIPVSLLLIGWLHTRYCRKKGLLT